MECPREIKRRIGKLESFDPTPGKSQARIRVRDGIIHLPTSTRGVLQPDNSIALCANGDRYDKIPQGTLIVFDATLNFEGKDPMPGLWAPKVKT
jgi:hypothetical protein